VLSPALAATYVWSGAPHGLWRALLLCALLAWSSPGARCAEGLGIARAQLDAEGDGYRLDSQLQIDLPPALVDAVDHGVTLNFEVVFTLVRPRTFWFDATVVERRELRQIAFSNLTRYYRVTLGTASETAERLEDALATLSTVRIPRVFPASALEPGKRYRAQLRVSLDWSHLPKPLQVSAITSRAWRVAPGELEWEFSP
jgi:Domain of unknown function (DUF4390)